jgi:type I restriction enzyme R subunit
VTGALSNARAEVAVLHAAVGAMKEIKPRADFEVYLKKFLQSLNLILPNESGHRYRGPARRFGYLLRMIKERYKDDSLNIADAGEKVKALINEHLIDLGINPRVPPIELLSPDFMEQVEALGWRSRRQSQRDGACAPKALHGALRRRPGVLHAAQRQTGEAHPGAEG